jgi:hypothetical protein
MLIHWKADAVPREGAKTGTLAANFADWLREPAQQAGFGGVGFRSLDGQPPASLLDAGTTTATTAEQRALAIPCVSPVVKPWIARREG